MINNTSLFTDLDTQNYNYGTRTDIPVAEKNQTYFAYWDGIGGTGAEIPNQTAYFIKYIIDTEGNVTNPEPNSSGTRKEAIGLYNLTNNFEVGKKAIIKLIESDPTIDTISKDSDILGTYTITGIGTLKNIMTTEIGKKPSDYLDTMSFYDPKKPDSFLETVPFFNARYKWASSYAYTKAIEQSASYVEPVWQNGWDNAQITPPSNPPHIYPYRTIQPLTSSLDAGTRVRFTLLIYLSQIKFAVPNDLPAGSWNSNAANNNSIYFRIKNHTTGQNIFGSGWITPTSTDINSPNGYWFETGWRDVKLTDKIVVTAQLANNASGSGANYKAIRIDNDSLFSAEQEYNPGQLIAGYNMAYSPYFRKIEHYFDHSTLSFSNDMESIFGSSLAQSVTSDQQLFGFSPSTIPFGNLQIGDYIRFEYNPDMVHRIIGLTARSSSVDGSVTSLSMNVAPSLFPIPSGSDNSDITSSINTDHFTIYRIENDGRYVILDVPKTSKGNAYSGILQSEFSSQELLTKYDKLITDLTSKEIIQ
jgi:hypothetical protein